MSNNDFSNFEILEDGEIQYKVQEQVWSLWSFLVCLIAVFFSMLGASFLVCIINKECRETVPTVHVLLTNPLTAPFILLALTSCTYIFFITAFALYHKTGNRMLIPTTIVVYFSIGVILVVFPFTGWADNWGIFFFIVAFLAWMINVSCAFYSTYRVIVRRIELITIIIYFLTSVAYMVLKILIAKNNNNSTIATNLNIGLLTVELIGVASIVVYMIICLLYVRSVKIKVYPR